MFGLRETIVRLAVVGAFVGIAWLVFQIYSEQEIVDAAAEFWSWWSSLLTGELAGYWNPIGAAVTLAVMVLFVSSPLLRSRRRGRHHHQGGTHDSHHRDGTDGGFDLGGGDDGGGGDSD